MQTRRGWPAVAGGLALFLLLEDGLFRTGLYRTFLAPDSYAGNFEFMVEAERTRPVVSSRQVLAIGDSRMALRAWQANKLQSELTFGSAGIASSTPRVWHYTLRAVDPRRDRYEAILFLVDDYDDEDIAEDLRRRTLDIQLLIGRLGLADIPELYSSFAGFEEKWEAPRKLLLKGIAYRRDLREFLKNPRQRMADREFKRLQWMRALDSYEGEERALTGLQVDWKAMTVDYPEGLTEREKRLIDDVMLRPAAEQTGRMSEYRRLWFGRILERYRGTRTRILFCRVPRGPILRPESLVSKKGSSIRELAGVTLLDEHLFDSLERPEFFRDALHLNAEGSRRLTALLTGRIVELLGPPSAL